MGARDNRIPVRKTKLVYNKIRQFYVVYLNIKFIDNSKENGKLRTISRGRYSHRIFI